MRGAGPWSPLRIYFKLMMQRQEAPDLEARRLKTLLALKVLDTSPEERFDRVTRLAAHLFRAPVALISFVAAHRQWFKSRHGLAVQQLPREHSFCAHAIQGGETLVVRDALVDSRFRGHPLVVHPHRFRFYAGRPLAGADGCRVGTLCILDRRPRVFTREELRRLEDLALLVEAELRVPELAGSETGGAAGGEQALDESLEKGRQIAAGLREVFWSRRLPRRPAAVAESAAAAPPPAERQAVSAGAPGARVAGQDDWIEAVHPEDRSRVVRAMLARYREGVYDVEYRVPRPDGTTLWLRDRAFLVRGPRGDYRLNGITEDITARKQEQIALSATKEAAERANRAKSAFLANMSHELRTPLNSIIGFAELLSDRTFGELNPKQALYIHNILSSGRLLLDQISEVLDLAKIDADRLELDRSELALEPLLRELAVPVASLAAQSGLSFALRIASGLPPVRVDARRINQVVLNLLSNALKFTPAGGSIELSASQQPGSRTGAIRVAVKDSGIGIAPADQPRLFQPFEQVDASYGRRQQGTGLGLALSRRLVELHGGSIDVDSAGEGHGSTFSFSLPVAESQGDRPGT
jgi:signal transduction histidine kinase